MPAKTNTAPTALGGTKPSPDEPASNRAMKDHPAMARIPRLSPQPAAAVMPGLDPGIHALPSRHSRNFSAMPHTPRHSRASRSPRARPGWGNPEPAPLLSPGAGSDLNRGPPAQAFPRHSRERGNPEPQASEKLSETAPPFSAFPAIPGTAHQGRPSGDGTHFAAAPASKETPMTFPRAIPPREILFIDPGVSDIATLLGHLRPEVEPILLDPVRPAAHQMAAALAGERELAAIHVIAHGSPGRVDFTAGHWSAETVADDAENLAAIGRALAASGDLRLWSCRTAAGPAGAAFVAGLTQASGADTAAASGLVGAAALGGSWDLAARARRAVMQPPPTGRGMQVYAGLLAGVHRIISGDVPHDPAENVTYVVVNSRDKRVVATFSLPGRANIPKFSITVTVPSGTETYEAGRLDERGNFIPANFKVSETSQFSTGPMNAGEPRHGA